MNTNDETAKLLIVDDEKSNLDALVGLIGDQYRTVVARNGVKALKRARTEPKPDLILLDVLMPEMDGFELCRQLKADPATADIPILFITGRDSEQAESLCFEAGAVDFIRKPVTLPVLSARVRTHLALRQQQQPLQTAGMQDNGCPVVVDGGDSDEFMHRIERLNDIGIALSSERNVSRLLEIILLGAKELTNADAGTMYSVTPRQTLKFEILRTDSLGIAMGGTTGIPINFPELPLYKEGAPNLQMIAAFSAIKETTVNIPDAYEAEGFDFSGTRAFDQRTHYRSKSFLTVPLKNHENEIIGVLQLINSKHPKTGEIMAFSPEYQKLAESLASQAAIALTNQKLIADLKALFESFIQSIASAIDDKSPYTGGHCHRVPVLAEMLAKAVSETDAGSLKDIRLSEEDMYELKIASWLHDCGKVVTPTEVVDKGTKLETIFDRIHLLDLRFEMLKRDLELDFLRQRLAAVEAGAPAATITAMEEELRQEFARIDTDRDFVRETNIGGEFMSGQRQDRIRAIARRRWIDTNGLERPFLSDNEVYNLNIPKGTITPEEREIINNHVVATIKMLDAIPFPKHLSMVPEIAGGHHEQMNGKGYPKGLTGDQMSLQARMVAIADVFEALTARDRPYKKGKPLSASLQILGFMMKDGHIDPDLFKVFIDKKIYLDYAQEYLAPEQIDQVAHEKIPGYVA